MVTGYIKTNSGTVAGILLKENKKTKVFQTIKRLGTGRICHMPIISFGKVIKVRNADVIVIYSEGILAT